MKQYPILLQGNSRHCGSLCVAMILKYFGNDFNINKYPLKLISWQKGVSLLDLKNLAENVGFKSAAFKIAFETLKNIELPVIAHWHNKHFIVIYRFIGNNILVGDPTLGIIEYNKKEFINGWVKKGERSGIILTLSQEKNTEVKKSRD